MVRIRLRRVGAKKQPHYRVVVADQHHPRDGRHIEVIGHYNPRTTPVTLKIKEDRALYWLSQGAQPSDPVQHFLKKQGTLARLARLKAGESFDALVAEYETGDVLIEEPVAEAAAAKAAESVEEPVAEAAAAKAAESVEEPVTEAAAAKAAESVEEPVVEAAAAKAEESVEEPVVEAAAAKAEESVEEPVAQVTEVEETPEPDAEPQD